MNLELFQVRHIQRIFIIGLLTCLAVAAEAQNQLHLSQYALHQAFLNPASISRGEFVNGALLYRKQWVGFDGAPSVMGANVNMPFKDGHNFLGLTVFNDQIGVNRRTDVSLTYAYRLKLSRRSTLSFGLAATLALLQSNLSDVETTDPGDPVFSADSRTLAAPDFKFGLYYKRKRFYLGFALPRLMDNEIIFDESYRNRIGFNFANMHYHLHSGYDFRLSDRLDLQTAALMKFVTGAPVQFDVSAMLSYHNIFAIGGAYRSQSIIVVMANVQITRYLRLGYAYDYDFTPLRQVASGSHEIMLLFNLVRTMQEVRIDDPRF